MATYKALSPAAEVNGRTVLSVLEVMPLRRLAEEILLRNKIGHPKPERWYPQQAWLDFFKEIESQVGTDILFSMGMQIPAHATFPPSIDSIRKALASIDIAYHINHRNGEIGHYRFIQAGPRAAQIICNNPYPCDFDRGIITTMATMFKPKDSPGVKITHAADSCRKKGADICTYNITW